SQGRALRGNGTLGVGRRVLQQLLGRPGARGGVRVHGADAAGHGSHDPRPIRDDGVRDAPVRRGLARFPGSPGASGSTGGAGLRPAEGVAPVRGIPIATTLQPATSFADAYPCSRKVHLEGPDGIRVPMREITLDDSPDGTPNPPLLVYDTSGPQGRDVREGLP